MAWTPPPHTSQNWTITKPAASGRRGMVVSQSRDAALAGVALLDAGGNAVDAAVGAALALAVVEPWNSGLGGIGFALLHRAGQATADTIDFGPVAPAGLTPAAFRLTGRMKQDLFSWPEVEGDANIHGPLSFCIPSAVAGYAHMHGRFGVLPLRDVMAPALALARRGLAADWYTTLKLANAAATLRRYPESARIYLPDGLPPVAPYQGTPGFLQLGRLADTLDQLAHAGLRDFYEGDVATGIAADCKALGGVITADDLRHCETRVQPAVTLDWHGSTIQLAAGLTAAPTMIAVQQAMRGVRHGGEPDAAWFAALATAMKAAYAERLTSLGATEPSGSDTCTTHLTVCDEAGSMLSMTTTLLSSMGSRVVLPGSGVLMNNGVMWFDPAPNQPNSIAPGKRPLTNMCPVIVQRDGVPVLAMGASGGRRILAAVVQMLAFIQDFGMPLEAAAHHPRIDVSDPGSINADRRLPSGIIDALRHTGPVDVVEHAVIPLNFACPNVITQHDGLRAGISDAMSPWSAAVAQAVSESSASA